MLLPASCTIQPARLAGTKVTLRGIRNESACFDRPHGNAGQ